MQQKGILPEETSFVKVSSPLVKITAIKKDKGNNSFIMRLVNVENVDKQTDISLWNPAVKVVKTNLIEEDINDTGQKGSDVRLNVGKNSIETYRIILEE
jgi:alpha-mannosidase